MHAETPERLVMPAEWLGLTRPIFDLSCPIYEGMWSYSHPFDPFTMHQFSKTGWESTYSENISLSVLTGTYLETTAHIDRSAPTIDAVPLERLVVSAVAIDVPTPPRGRVALADVDRALDNAGITLQPGEAALLRTGWETRLRDPEFVNEGPRLGQDLVESLIERRIGLLGADLPRFDDVDAVTSVGIVHDVLQAGVLILAPLVGLAELGTSRGVLIALPLRIVGATASPCRAIFVRAPKP